MPSRSARRRIRMKVVRNDGVVMTNQETDSRYGTRRYLNSGDVIDCEPEEVERGRTFALNVRIIRTVAQLAGCQRRPQ
jgi:hypothetical protein